MTPAASTQGGAVARDDGGFAFPQTAVYDASREMVNEAGAYGIATGMSLRDYFAASAIRALPLRDWSHVKDDDTKVAMWAECAYRVADAMLAARQEGST